MEKYTDDEIRAMPKITIKIAADYLGISTNLLTLGMRKAKDKKTPKHSGYWW